MLVSLSFRSRILLLVLVVAVVPLGITGLWMARATTRSGQALLQEQLTLALNRTVSRLVSNWIELRAPILGLAEDESLRAVLEAGGSLHSTPMELSRPSEGLFPFARAVFAYDSAGAEVYSIRSTGSPGGSEGAFHEVEGIRYRVAVWKGLTDMRLGTVEVLVGQEHLLPLSDVPPETAGMVIGLFDPNSGQSLRPVPFDPAQLRSEQFRWGGERWVTSRRNLMEPPVIVVVAAPAGRVVAPFRRATLNGTIAFLAVAAVGFLAAMALSRRLTLSLERLSEAAQAVSAGDLQKRVSKGGEDEVGRVAEAFNLMTASLERTLEELTQKESLAAVGEFAASLAHEIRNPLAAVRIDLQKAIAELSPDSESLPFLRRCLSEIDRLNSTIEDTLAQARIGRRSAEPIDLRTVLEAGAEASRAFFQERGATLVLDAQPGSMMVPGDPDALRQVFLNLLKNSAEALGPGGEARVDVIEMEGAFELAVSDNGSGIPEELQQRVFDPLFTTRTEGTGLGLAIVKRIVDAHGGTIALESAPGMGTTARVRLPRM